MLNDLFCSPTNDSRYSVLPIILVINTISRLLGWCSPFKQWSFGLELALFATLANSESNCSQWRQELKVKSLLWVLGDLQQRAGLLQQLHICFYSSPETLLSPWGKEELRLIKGSPTQAKSKIWRYVKGLIHGALSYIQQWATEHLRQKATLQSVYKSSAIISASSLTCWQYSWEVCVQIT